MNVKVSFLIISLLISVTLKAHNPPSYFNDNLSEISSEFRENILDMEKCEELKKKTNVLTNEIKNALANNTDYTTKEIIELKEYYSEAKAIESYITVISGYRKLPFNIDEFHLANKRIKANVTLISLDEYCVKIIKIKIGDFVTFFAENNTSKSFKLKYKYKWKATDGVYSGSGNSGITSYSLRYLTNNKDRTALQDILITFFDCQEINSMSY